LYDIDEILKRAETREEANYLSATEELLSQFKVANFSTMEDEPIDTANNPSSSGGNGSAGNYAAFEEKRKQLDDKSWLDIIPEADRKRIELEEEEEKLRQMHLTTLESRRRTNTNQPKTGSGKQAAGTDDDENYHSGDGSVNSSDSEHHLHGGKKSKSGKGKSGNRQKDEHVVKGLNGQEVRRFIRSYRKFPAPLSLIDTIAQDANLEEKSQATLIEFAKKMQLLCRASIAKYESARDPVELENGKINFFLSSCFLFSKLGPP
jgi:chromodomain-helicase-DNA-binding protein 1